MPVTPIKPGAEEKTPQDIQRDALNELRVPFPPHQVGYLPRAVSKDDNNKMECKAGTRASADGKFCGGYHVRSMHLDYVGHAALTDRMLETDLYWTWEPVAYDENGLPAMDRLGGLWIKLTIAGVTRLGYGDAQGKTGPNAVKEAIGDALRNAGMRFGLALDLWHKGDLHDAAAEQGQAIAGTGEHLEPAADTPSARDWVAEAREFKTADEVLQHWRKAKRMKVPPEELQQIQNIGSALRDQEEQAVEANRIAQEKAEKEVAAAFLQPPPEDKAAVDATE